MFNSGGKQSRGRGSKSLPGTPRGVSPARNTEPFPLFPRSTSHLRTLSSTSLNRASPPLRFIPSPSQSPHHSRPSSPHHSKPPSPSRSPTHSRSTSNSSVRFTGRLEIPLVSPSDSHNKTVQELTARLVELQRGYQELEAAYEVVTKERDFYRELANPSRNHSSRGPPNHSPSSSRPPSPAWDPSVNVYNRILDPR